MHSGLVLIIFVLCKPPCLHLYNRRSFRMTPQLRKFEINATWMRITRWMVKYCHTFWYAQLKIGMGRGWGGTTLEWDDRNTSTPTAGYNNNEHMVKLTPLTVFLWYLQKQTPVMDLFRLVPFKIWPFLMLLSDTLFTLKMWKGKTSPKLNNVRAVKMNCLLHWPYLSPSKMRCDSSGAAPATIYYSLNKKKRKQNAHWLNIRWRKWSLFRYQSPDIRNVQIQSFVVLPLAWHFIFVKCLIESTLIQSARWTLRKTSE